MQAILRATGLGLLLVLTGCGPKERPLTAVSGRVYYRGQPLSGGTIVFTPDPERGGYGPQAWAEINAEGYYSLRTKDQAGAVPGWHRVTIAPLAPPPEPGETSPSLNSAPGAAPAPAGPGVDLPRRYRDPELSGQCVQVQPGHPNTLDLYLQ